MSSESLPKPKRRRTSKSKDEQDIHSNYYTSMFLQHGDESTGMTTQVLSNALSAYWGVFFLFFVFAFCTLGKCRIIWRKTFHIWLQEILAFTSYLHICMQEILAFFSKNRPDMDLRHTEVILSIYLLCFVHCTANNVSRPQSMLMMMKKTTLGTSICRSFWIFLARQRYSNVL